MADKSKIEWTDATWNPITGCSVVSPGCTNCYAMKLAGGRMRHHWSRRGLTQPSKAGPVWTGEVRFNEDWLRLPLHWKKPRRVFVCAHGDLFHESVPDEWIDQVFAVMALCPQHTFQVLSKRADRMREYFEGRRSDFGRASEALHELEHSLSEDAHDEAVDRLDIFDSVGEPLPNVWLGVSCEDRPRKDRIDDLRNTPAAVRFLSLEPLLEDLGDLDLTGIGWVIVGGESGKDARPMHPDWVRSIRDQCQAADAPFFFKQWGHYRPVDLDRERGVQDWFLLDRRGALDIPDYRVPDDDAGEVAVQPCGKKAAGALLDGREWREMPS